MSEINIEILQKRMLRITVEISKSIPNEFQLNVESKVEVKTPKEDKDNTTLILMQTDIKIPDSDEININVNAEFVFKFDRIPDNYNKIIEDKCIQLAQNVLFDSLDNILLEMGYKKLGLAKKQ